MKRIIFYIFIAMLMPLTAAADGKADNLGIRNVQIHRNEGKLFVEADIVLDDLKLGANKQLFVTPVLRHGEQTSATLPSLLISGRNMHIAYERKTIKNIVADQEVLRKNGTPQTIHYSTSTPFEKWMLGRNADLTMVVDTCGCGDPQGRGTAPAVPLNLIPEMTLTYQTPEVTELPIIIHEGEARVQFEVDSVTLHDQPYKCRNGQRIDNRAQLAIIEDSIRYALTDPNVEIASINICGYASPESPYVHNDYLATNRSRALAEYIGKKHNIPADRCHYTSVPENWEEFREQVIQATDLTDTQRRDLLELIDRPAYGPADFDAKEKELKTSPKFAKLYRSTILPQWFPHLRATKFAISTRLMPLSDEKLAEVIKHTPQLMSLNQMMRVARLYPEGSDDFNRVIEIALRYNPDDAVANLNAGIAALQNGDNARAAELIAKGGNTPEAENARGVMACNRGDYEEALKHFRAAGNLPEAVKNRKALEE